MLDGLGLAVPRSVLPRLGPETTKHKKIETSMGPWPLVAAIQSNDATTNQVSALAVEDILAKRRGRGEAYRRTLSHRLGGRLEEQKQ